MLRKTCIILLTLLTAALVLASCRPRGVIPKDDMARIYYDMYMTDEAVKSDRIFRRMSDTLRVYEPVFNKYGYSFEDYIRSVDYYLQELEEFQEIFEETKLMLEKREARLKAILEAEGKRQAKWSIPDSLEIITADGISSGPFYKALRMMFFQADTAVPSSPQPDSAFMERPQIPFLIFSDSAVRSDIDFAFYRTPGFMEELRIREQERIEALKKEKEEKEKDAEDAEKNGRTKNKASSLVRQNIQTVSSVPPIRKKE